MSHWFSVAIQGEARVSADEDPIEVLNPVLTSLEETEEDLEFDVEPVPTVHHLSDGSTLWVYPLTARYSESFSSIEDAEAAAIEVAKKLELVEVEATLGFHSLKIVFLMQTVEPEDWDDPEAGQPPAMIATGEVDQNGALVAVRLEVGGDAAKRSQPGQCTLGISDCVYMSQVIDEFGDLDWWDLIMNVENPEDALEAAVAIADIEHAPRRSQSRIVIIGPIGIPTAVAAEAPFE